MKPHCGVTAAFGCLIALLASKDAWSYNGSSFISYDTGTEVLSGYADTERDWWDSSQYYYCWQYEWDDWNGLWCRSWTQGYRRTYAAANVYAPGGQQPHLSSDDLSWTDAVASFSAAISPNNHAWRGTWTVYGEHYVVEDWQDWYCTDINWCFPVYVGQAWHHIASTNATAEVPYCIHHGTPPDGWLSGDESLWDNGTGYYHFLGTDAPDTDDWACANYAHQKIVSVGLWWNQAPEIGIGDLSLQHGGWWADHDSHQNGLDVDVRYMRNDGIEGPLDFDANPAQYHEANTNAVIEQFCSLGGASVIYVDARANITASCAVNLGGHSNHFHVRLPDPDGTGN